MKKFKKIIASMLATITVVSSVMGGINVSASPRDDRLTQFTVSGHYEHNTKTREKEDDTSATIMITSTNPSGSKASVKVYGTYTDSDNPYGGTNQTVGTPKIVVTSSYYTYLPNYVWENMKVDSTGHIRNIDVYAYLALYTYSTSSSSSDFSANGLWSPDSV